MSSLTQTVKPRRTRTTFIAGRLRHKREPRPCSAQWHAGPLVDTETFAAAGGIWANIGNCACCGSTVHRNQIRRPA